MEHLRVAFTAPLASDDRLGFNYLVVYVPQDITLDYKAAKIKRILIHLDGETHRLALNSDGEGGTYIILSGIARPKKWGVGKMLDVVLEPDPNPNQVDLPEEWAALLEQDEELLSHWEKMTPGKQRSYCIYLNQGKSVETRIKNALNLAQKIKTGTTYLQRKKSES